MKLDDLIKSLQAIQRELGNVECVAFTAEHGPFELCVSAQGEDEGQFGHVEFGPDIDIDADDKIYKES